MLIIADYGLQCISANGEIIDIKFGAHRDAVRKEFGFPDKRQVADGPTYHPSETTIHET